MNKKDKISWAIPVLACALIFVLVSLLGTILGVGEISLMKLGIDFLLGAGLGYIVWLFL